MEWYVWSDSWRPQNENRWNQFAEVSPTNLSFDWANKRERRTNWITLSWNLINLEWPAGTYSRRWTWKVERSSAGKSDVVQVIAEW